MKITKDTKPSVPWEERCGELFESWLNKFYVNTEESHSCPNEYFCIFDAGEAGCTREHIEKSKQELLAFIRETLESEKRAFIKEIESELLEMPFRQDQDIKQYLQSKRTNL